MRLLRLQFLADEAHTCPASSVPRASRGSAYQSRCAAIGAAGDVGLGEGATLPRCRAARAVEPGGAERDVGELKPAGGVPRSVKPTRAFVVAVVRREEQREASSTRASGYRRSARRAPSTARAPGTTATLSARGASARARKVSGVGFVAGELECRSGCTARASSPCAAAFVRRRGARRPSTLAVGGFAPSCCLELPAVETLGEVAVFEQLRVPRGFASLLPRGGELVVGRRIFRAATSVQSARELGAIGRGGSCRAAPLCQALSSAFSLLISMSATAGSSM